ncbi:hypothetical protein ACFL2E_05800 [Thermodesulfobacteriota bacterium]
MVVYLCRRLSGKDKKRILCVLCVFAVKEVFSGTFGHFFIHRKGAEDAENIIILIFAETPKIKKPHSFGILALYVDDKFQKVNIKCGPKGMVVYLCRRLSGKDKKRNKLCDLCVLSAASGEIYF